jgi:hypothetical protein
VLDGALGRAVGQSRSARESTPARGRTARPVPPSPGTSDARDRERSGAGRRPRERRRHPRERGARRALVEVVGARHVLQRPSALRVYDADGLPGLHRQPALACSPARARSSSPSSAARRGRGAVRAARCGDGALGRRAGRRHRPGRAQYV